LVPAAVFFRRRLVSQLKHRCQTQKQQQKPEKKEFYIGLDAPVQGIKDYVYRYKPYDGVFQQKNGDYRVVLISMGEQYDPGYDVLINKVAKEEKRWLIATTMRRPKEEIYSGPGHYPYKVVSIIDDGKPIEVVTISGENKSDTLKTVVIPEGKKLAVSKNFIVFTPFEGEEIKSPVKIRGKARVFEATFRITMEDGHYQLAKKNLMSDMGAPGWGNFELDLPFDKPTNPQGFIILSYPNMANGDVIEELMLFVKFKEQAASVERQ
jgi:hypothetical protein